MNVKESTIAESYTDMEVLHMLRVTANLVNQIRRSQLISTNTVHCSKQRELVHQVTRLQHIVDFVCRCWPL